jgi:hypothetical protein
VKKETSLGGKDPVAMTFPQGGDSMSDVKYIGLDVHKEAISIAVLNGSGKLVMESIIDVATLCYASLSL